MIFVNTTFASPSATRPVSGATLEKSMKCVSNNIHNFILLPSFVLSFIHIYVLTSFFKLDLAMRDELLPHDRIRAIQEELAGFYLDHVIHKAREYHVEVEIDLRC